MIEVLDPVRDRPRISSLLDPAAGIRLVDAWKTALPELASLDLPHLSPGTADAKASLGEYLAAVWTEAAIEAASRYVLYPGGARSSGFPTPTCSGGYEQPATAT